MAVRFTESAARKVAQMYRDWTHWPRSQLGGGGASGGAYQPQNMRFGLITNVVGSSHAARYDCRDLEDTSVVLTNQTPAMRLWPTTIDIEAAAVNSVCVIGRHPTAGWRLAMAAEKPLTQACESAANGGTASSNSTLSLSTGRSEFFRAVYTLKPTTFGTTNGLSSNAAIEIGTFPLGDIMVLGGEIDIVLTAASVTRACDVALGTTATSGGSGITLAQSDICTAVTSDAISSSGTAYQRTFPNAASVSNDTGRIMTRKEGSTTAATVYLNLHPTAAWNATDTVTVTGQIRLHFINLGVIG